MRRDETYLRWREDVLLRDNFTCSICNKTPPKGLNAHHLIPKNFTKYALDVDNGLTLCPGCHTLSRYSAHKHPIWFTEWLKINKRHIYDQVNRRMQLLRALGV